MDELFAAMERIGQVHPFAKGMGLAAPQIGIGRAAAVVQPPDNAPAIILLNPQITTRSDETDEQYEGCLSFFDVRGLVPRPLKITVETTTLTGETVTTGYDRASPASSTTKSITSVGFSIPPGCCPEPNRSPLISTGRRAGHGRTRKPDRPALMDWALGPAFTSGAQAERINGSPGRR